MRLVEPAVQPPCLARLDPADRRRGDALLQQPYAGVQGCLARADDDEALGALPNAHDLAGGHAANAVGHLERRRTGRGNGAFEIRGVDDLPPHAHFPRLLREPGDKALLPQVFAAGKIANTAAGQKAAMHHVREVSPDLVRAGELVVAGIRPGHIEGVLPKRHRADSIEGGRLMETYVGIGVYPVSAGRVAAIDYRDRRVGMREQRVGKRHRRGPGADHEIVRFELFVDHLAMIIVAAQGAPNEPVEKVLYSF